MSEAILDTLAAKRAEALDAARPEAVSRQKKRGRLTARSRIDRLVDPGTFSEYGLLAGPAHADVEGPADGVVTGVGQVNGRDVCLVAFDYTVFGGTMGQIGKVKVDRMIGLARDYCCPFVVLAEGGGARAQDLGITSREGTGMFVDLARLSGRVPMLAGVFGPAFAGHANLVAFCDLVVATADSSMGVAGPPMVEAATGIRLRADEIGPIDLHASTGAVDVIADDDEHGIDVLCQLIGLLSAVETSSAEPESPEALSRIVPTNPRQAYDVGLVIRGLADADSIVEARPNFGRSVITCFGRLGGIPVGIVANQPSYQAGAINADGADKIARFIRICDAHGLPLLFLVDTPGFMVGREAEATAVVRHSARIVHALAHSSLPVLTVVMRKAYGLAYYALGAPPFDPLLIIEWPTAEYGGMGLGGAAKILDASGDGSQHTGGSDEALSTSLHEEHTSWVAARRFSIDDLISPDETRDRLLQALNAVPRRQRLGSGGPIDPW